MSEFWNKVRPDKPIKITPEAPELAPETISKPRGIKPLPKAKKPAEVKIEGIPKELEPLAKEARKYKSAEEFVESLEKKGKVYYHGTRTKFDKFTLERYAPNITARAEGPGVYFTDDKKLALSYTGKGGELKKVVLNVKNPMTVSQRKITDSQLFKLVKSIWKKEPNILEDYGIYTTDKKKALRDLVNILKENKTDVDILAELHNAGFLLPTDLNKEFMKITGYDGIIRKMPNGKKIVVALHPDQIVILDDFYNQAIKGVKATKPALKETWQKISTYPKKGDYVRVNWKGKTYEGTITGEKPVRFRTGYVAREITTKEGVKKWMPWTSKAKYEVKIEKPTPTPEIKPKAKPEAKPKIKPKIKPEIKPKEPEIPKEIHKSDKELIEKLIKRLKAAPLFRGKQEKLYTEARAKKLAKLLKIRGKEKGEERFYKELAALKGELPKLQFQPIREGFDQKSVDRLFDMIAEKRILDDWEKVNAQKGLLKVLEGRVPTKAEISLLNDVFGERFTKALLEKRPLFEKMTEMGMQLYNLSRSLMAGFFDFSATCMQNLLFAYRHPLKTSENFVKSLRMFASETYFKKSMEEIVMRPTYRAMKKAKLPLTEMGGIISEREEMFMAPIAEKIPVIGKVIRATGRAYTGFLNRMRADVFDAYYKSAKLLGIDVADERFLSTLGRFIGNATGRGRLPGQLERAMPVLSQGLFSARKLAATFDMINPEFYITLHPYVRRKVLETWLAFLGGGLTLLGIGKLAGAEVETDPTNADFGKIKIGNTRINVFGSYQSIAVLLARLWKGYITSSTTKKRMVLGRGYKPVTRLDIISRFFSMKQHPTLTFIFSLLRGTDQIGRRFDWKEDALKMYTPMVFQDGRDLFKEHGATRLSFFGVVLAMLGVSVQTYAPTIRFNEKITKEVRRLQDKGYSEIVGIGAYMPGYPSLSLKENDLMQRFAEKLANYRISNLLASEEYKKLSDEERARKINNEVKKAIRRAKVRMILKKIEGLEGEELRRKLKKFKDDGLLTKTIFKEIRKEREIRF